MIPSGKKWVLNRRNKTVKGKRKKTDCPLSRWPKEWDKPKQIDWDRVWSWWLGEQRWEHRVTRNRPEVRIAMKTRKKGFPLTRCMTVIHREL